MKMKFLRHNIIYSRRERKRKKFSIQKIKKLQMNYPIYLILKLILILTLLLSYYYFVKININYSPKKLPKKIVIEVGLRHAEKRRRGPSQLHYSLSKVLPYETKNCKFMPVKQIDPTEETINKKYVDYFLLCDPIMEEQTYDKWKFYNKTHSLLLGPAFLPHDWNDFPCNKFWNERRYKEILKSIKAEVVHSDRVRDHLLNMSNNQEFINKFINFRACTQILPKYVKPFKEREIDIMLYEKYANNNHNKQAIELYNLLRRTNKRVEILKYGSYNQPYEFQMANNSKFVIYFSFYDTGALSLKEIQNYGVISFSLQKDLVISNKTSYFIPELEDNDMTTAFNKIIKIIDNIYNNNPDSIMIANINQEINNCEGAFDELCDNIMQKER